MSSKHSLKERQRKEREQLILDYAEQTMLEKGYHAVSMDEIAAGVGIAKGTLYLHFPTKEDLAYALVKPKLLSFLNSVEEVRALPISPPAKLESLLQREMKGAFFQFLLHSRSDMTSIFKSSESEIHEILSRIFGGIHAILKEGQQEGLFDPELPVEFMSSAFVNLFEPHLYRAMVESGKMSVETYNRHAANLFFRGIMQQKEMKEDESL